MSISTVSNMVHDYFNIVKENLKTCNDNSIDILKSNIQKNVISLNLYNIFA